MVRYDKCVESLYDRGLIEDKNKSLQMLKVMKGAISMSKSKTGECIFRTNKLERNNLERLVKIDKRNSQYNIARVDTSKKAIVGRWMKMLDRQTTCSSQTLLEEALYIREPNSNPMATDTSPEQSPRQHEDDGHLRKYLDLRLTRDESAPYLKAKRTEPEVSDSTQNEAQEAIGNDEFVTERKEIRERYTASDSQIKTDNKLSERNAHGALLSKSAPLVLPSVANAGFKQLPKVKNSEEEDNHPLMFERDLTNWKDWRLKDKSWIKGYIRKEKTRHEDLILRNALVKIETDMSGANSIRRQQIRQKLQAQRDEEVRRERDQTFDKLTQSDSSSCRTKSVTSDKIMPKLQLKKSLTYTTSAFAPTSRPERKTPRTKSQSEIDRLANLPTRKTTRVILEPEVTDTPAHSPERIAAHDENSETESTRALDPQTARDNAHIEVTGTPSPLRERRMSREKNVKFSDIVSKKAKAKPKPVNRSKVCRERTVCIVYQEPEQLPGTVNPAGSLSVLSTGHTHRRRSSTLSLALSESKLPIISEG